MSKAYDAHIKRDEGDAVPAAFFLANSIRYIDQYNKIPVSTGGELPGGNITNVMTVFGRQEGTLQNLYMNVNGYMNMPFSVDTPEGQAAAADHVKAYQAKIAELGIASRLTFMPMSMVGENGVQQEHAVIRPDLIGLHQSEVEKHATGVQLMTEFYFDGIKEPELRQAYREVFLKLQLMDNALTHMPYQAFEKDGVTPQRLADGREYIPNSLGGMTDSMRNPDSHRGGPQTWPLGMMGLLDEKTFDYYWINDPSRSREDRLSIYEARGDIESLELGLQELQAESRELQLGTGGIMGQLGVSSALPTSNKLKPLSEVGQAFHKRLTNKRAVADKAATAESKRQQAEKLAVAERIRQRFIGTSGPAPAAPPGPSRLERLKAQLKRAESLKK